MDSNFDLDAHRPWPLPDRPWVLFMRWHDLLFAHWPVRPEVLRPHVPAGLEIDTFDRWAWIGVVPFYMTGVRPRLVPEKRFGMRFPELNVRTYIKSRGRNGVYFFSLDATSRLSVRAARLTFGLNYFDAEMSCRREGDRVRYLHRRVHRGAPPAELDMEYGPVGDVFHAEPGTLEHFLTERYGLYSEYPRGTLRFGDINHRPWPLQLAEAEFRRNRMVEQLGIELPDEKPLLHFSEGVEVAAWTLKALSEEDVSPE
jgi:uncharacterized protein